MISYEELHKICSKIDINEVLQRCEAKWDKQPTAEEIERSLRPTVEEMQTPFDF